MKVDDDFLNQTETNGDFEILNLKNDHDEVSLNSFSFDSWLGQGAFGSVFLVQGEQSNEEWVIKRVDLNQKAFDNAEMIQRQVSESEILQVLRHPNIIRL